MITQEQILRTAPLEYPKLKEILKLSKSWCDLLHAQIGINTESGEFGDAIKKTLIYGQDIDTDNMKEELGDLLWYIALAARALDTSIESLIEDNHNKLKIRYPEKFTEELAKERLDKKQTCMCCGSGEHITIDCPIDIHHC